MRLFKTLLATAAITIAGATGANAATVLVRDNPNDGPSVFTSGLFQTVNVTYDNAMDVSVTRNVNAGVFSLQYDDGGAWQDFLTFCLQISESLSLPMEHERVDGATYAGANAEAMGIIFGNLLNDTHGLLDGTSAAAIQTMLWEIVEDGANNFDLQMGTFQVNSESVAPARRRTLASCYWRPIRFIRL